jgi:hypothetical protein
VTIDIYVMHSDCDPWRVVRVIQATGRSQFEDGLGIGITAVRPNIHFLSNAVIFKSLGDTGCYYYCFKAFVIIDGANGAF